jgi:type IV secretory pathway VirB10-like protein
VHASAIGGSPNTSGGPRSPQNLPSAAIEAEAEKGSRNKSVGYQDTVTVLRLLDLKPPRKRRKQTAALAAVKRAAPKKQTTVQKQQQQPLPPQQQPPQPPAMLSAEEATMQLKSGRRIQYRFARKDNKVGSGKGRQGSEFWLWGKIDRPCREGKKRKAIAKVGDHRLHTRCLHIHSTRAHIIHELK